MNISPNQNYNLIKGLQIFINDIKRFLIRKKKKPFNAWYKYRIDRSISKGSWLALELTSDK